MGSRVLAPWTVSRVCVCGGGEGGALEFSKFASAN